MSKSEPNDYRHTPTDEELKSIRATPCNTSAGKPFDWYVRQNLDKGNFRLECVRADVLGLARPLEIYRAARKTDLVKPWPRSDDEGSYCPAHWADLAIGRGACGLRCRACFLILTHRLFCDPTRHVVYENVEDHARAVRKWLQRPNRKNLGLGIDCSDSLLYEGVTGHARRLIPLFAASDTNPSGCKLILLTKSINVHYLEGLPTDNVLATFSLNPESIADLWEGKFPDGVRVTPPVPERLRAAQKAQAMGFEVRWRVDPIFPVEGWRDMYADFFRDASSMGHAPTRITLGTYREAQRSLSQFAEGWGLPPIEWSSSNLERDGAHRHISRDQRLGIYRFLAQAVKDAWRGTGHDPVVALCKEPRFVRQELGLCHEMCNCG